MSTTHRVFLGALPATAPAVARAGGGLEVRHGYQVLDLQPAFAQDLLPEDSLTYWLAALERMGAPDVPDKFWARIGERIKQPTEATEMGQTYTEWVENHQPQVLVRAMGAEQLARVGDTVVDCDTGDELLAAASNGATEGG